MQTFRINDDVQLAIEQNLQRCKYFYFATCNSMEYEFEKGSQNVWLLTSGTESVLRNFMDLIINKYEGEKKYRSHQNKIGKDHKHVVMVILK